MRSNDFLNAEDVARFLHLGKNSVYQLAKTGELASYRMGRKLRFTREDVDAYLVSMHNTAAPGDSGAIRPISMHAEAATTETEDGRELVRAASFGTVPGIPFVIAGDDAAAGIIAHSLNDAGIAAERKPCESYTALVDLYAGEASAAVIHLYDQASNSCNVPYVQRLAPGVSVSVMRLYGRSQGLIVQSGNPKRLTSWGSLLREGVRLSNRVKGSGARVLLDEKLRAMDARSESVAGYGTPPSIGTAAIRHVAGGLADVTVGTAQETSSVSGVQFIPLQTEWVDIVVRKTPEAKPVLRALKMMLGSDWMLSSLASIGADDLSKLGSVVFES